jgi:transcriptional regulator with XRE-family HTH domain
MNIQTTIGLRIKEIRTEKNLTQEAVAFKAEIDRVENGKRNVSVETLEKILCNGLDMNFHEFFCNGLFNDKKKGK